MRENNSSLNVKNISKWFVVLWIIVAISVLGICIIMCYDNSFKNNNNMGILFGIILLCVFSIVIILAIKNTEKIYVSLQKYDEIDCITGEFNDNYMKNNISNIIQNNDNCVLIGVVIENIEDIARIVGIEKTNIIIKDFYNKIQLTIRNNKDEILIHSYFGNFKILKNINSMGEILYYIKKNK